MARVTIAMPAYNAGAFIGQALDSLIGQTYRDIEIIVSDNHSTDNTREVVERYSRFGVKLVTCPQEQIREGTPLDNCLSSCQNWDSLPMLGTGEFIGIFHADDVYSDRIVERQVDFFARHSRCTAVFALCRHMHQIDRFPNQDLLTKLDNPEDEFEQLEFLEAICRRYHFFSSSGPLVRRDTWLKVGKMNGYRFEQASDTDLWIRFASFGTIGVLNQELVCYRVHLAQDSDIGRSLYRYHPMPIVKVLDYWLKKEGIKQNISDSALRDFTVLCEYEDLRIAFCMMADGLASQARNVLKQLPTPDYQLIRKLLAEHRQGYLARLFLGKAMAVFSTYCQCRWLAGKLLRSRVGFPYWG